MCVCACVRACFVYVQVQHTAMLTDTALARLNDIDARVTALDGGGDADGEGGGGGKFGKGGLATDGKMQAVKRGFIDQVLQLTVRGMQERNTSDLRAEGGKMGLHRRKRQKASITH
jgi:hypothetical protein